MTKLYRATVNLLIFEIFFIQKNKRENYFTKFISFHSFIPYASKPLTIFLVKKSQNNFNKRCSFRNLPCLAILLFLF